MNLITAPANANTILEDFLMAKGSQETIANDTIEPMSESTRSQASIGSS